MSSIVTDSRGNPVTDSSGNPVRTGTPEAAKVSNNKLTPEQKKYFSSMDTTASVHSEADIAAVRAGGDEALAKAMEKQNSDAIAASGLKADTDAQQQELTPFDRSTAGEGADPTLQGPTRAQDQFTLRQAPTALMTGLPRMKFEYLATFRFAGEGDVFEEIFGDDLQNIDSQITNLNPVAGLDPSVPSAFKHKARVQRTQLQDQRRGVLDSIRRSLVFNVKQIDGPKVNFQYDTLNQYNRKRNVYRRVDYDPVNVRFLDTMDNSALKMFKYLYEVNLKDGRNRSKAYGGNSNNNKGVYQGNPLTTEDQFLGQHNFGLDNNIFDTTSYPIKSLDLFIVHGSKYNLIRFVHPKIISMDHDVMTYESSAPIEIGMQFAYETVLYETLNHDMGDARDVAIDFDQIFENTLQMPETPNMTTVETEGNVGTSSPEYDWTKLATSIPDEQPVGSVGSGSNVMTSGAFAHDINSAGAAYGGNQTFLDGFQSDLAQMNADLSKISTTPFSDSINQISQEVYGATRSAVSGFGAGGVSGGVPAGGQANSNSFWGGLGNKLKSIGPGDGKYNPDSKNFQKHKNVGYIKDSKGKIVKDSNGNAVRGGTYKESSYVDDYE